MSNYVNVNQTSNTVQLQNTDRQVIITGTPEQRDVTVVQPEVSVVTVSTIGPQGPRGERGQDGVSVDTGSFAITGSNTFIGNQIISGTLNVTGGVTSSLFGTSSWSNYSVTASYITLAQTASYVLNAVSASYSTNADAASSALTASYVNPLNQTVIITGSLIVSSSNTFTNIGLAIFSGSVVGTNGFTGSLQGTSSWSSNAVSASYIQYANIANRPTLLSSSAQIATDITGAFSSVSGSLSSRITVTEGSLVSITAATASYILASQTSSMSVLSASLATTASYILYSNVSNKPTLISSSAQIATDISGAINATSSSLSSRITSVEASIVTLNAATASYILASQTGSMRVLSASFATTASYILNAVSSSFALTASYALNASTATVDTGSLLITASVSNATITFTKGNNSTFPITVNNVTNATSASYVLYSNIANQPTLLSSSAQIATDISGAFTSVSGGFSNRITTVESSIIALNAATSSYVLTSQTSSMQVLSASFATTASYALNGGVTQIIPGTNISISPVSGVGAVTINSTGGTGTAFPYTGSAIISGSLIVTGSISATGGYSGSFSGSFFGNGSGLTGITATADTTVVEAYTWFLI